MSRQVQWSRKNPEQWAGLGEGLGFLNHFGPAFVEGLEEFLFGKALSLERYQLSVCSFAENAKPKNVRVESGTRWLLGSLHCATRRIRKRRARKCRVVPVGMTTSEEKGPREEKRRRRGTQQGTMYRATSGERAESSGA
jgi:hypothetical protein